MVICVNVPLIRWSTHWFKCDMIVPKEWAGHQVRFRWDSNCEAMVSEGNSNLVIHTENDGGK